MAIGGRPIEATIFDHKRPHICCGWRRTTVKRGIKECVCVSLFGKTSAREPFCLFSSRFYFWRAFAETQPSACPFTAVWGYDVILVYRHIFCFSFILFRLFWLPYSRSCLLLFLCALSTSPLHHIQFVSNKLLLFLLLLNSQNISAQRTRGGDSVLRLKKRQNKMGWRILFL